MSRHIVIIGNGISGITAARNCRKNSSTDRITVISAESKYFFSRTALMYIYMGHMKFEHTKPYEDWFWTKNKIDLIEKFVSQIDVEKQLIFFDDNNHLPYDILILATGSKPNKFGWPGQELKGVQGLYSLQDLELMEESTNGIKRAVIVGGGLIGVEMAEMLRSRDIDVTFLVREAQFWDNVLPEREAKLVGRHLRKHNIDLKLETELREIKGNSNGQVYAVETDTGELITCEFVGLTVGVKPNIDFLRNSGIEINKGILVDKFLTTNIKNVFAIGDCAEHRNPPAGRNSIEQVWYTGRIMGEVVAKNISGAKTSYNPGIWFNSAKFFDIEYQTYGSVGNKLREGEEEFYWEHEKGEICVHFIYSKADRNILGINAFGLRLRHKIFEKWIKEKRSIYYVLANLREVNFDPEFFNNYEKDIIEAFNNLNPEKKVQIERTGFFDKLLKSI